ncbi:MAG: hypothetical protein MJK12_20070 [Colwellia sp.]|nr:hypothetical protein [Colwellia sp.]
MQKPDIGLIFEESLPDDIFREFESSVKSDGLNLLVQSKEPMGAMMCAEWFILPVVMAYIGKSYFDGFLKEMGKDHYASLKESLSGLTAKVMSEPRIEPVLFGSKGKLSGNNPFSLACAVHAEAENGYTFKLLLPKHNNDCDYKLVISKFMDFLADYHLGLQTLDSIGCIWDAGVPPSNMIFVHYNTNANKIEWLNFKDYR